MLYPKNQEKELSRELFKAPTSEYRAAPFWAWNCELDPEMLKKQIEYFKQMGFGGFHIHARSGLSTPYLGKEFGELIRACADKAESEDMLTWLYDEDRWPSGYGGGFVTKEARFRQRFISFGTEPPRETVDFDDAVQNGRDHLIGAYDVCIDERGFLSGYKKVSDCSEAADGTRWYAVMHTRKNSPRFNDQTYVDTLNPDAIDKFIDVTYEFYKREVGERFGGSVPAIFTDEPQFYAEVTLDSAEPARDGTTPEAVMAWTPELPLIFGEKYGCDLIERLPELFFDLPDGRFSQVRYHFHDLVAERFASSYADRCGAWCEKNGIMLTGHLMEEGSLAAQTHSIGDAMRSYRAFQLPGIDMLVDRVELLTAKQTQSAVHQYGREGMLSELYGVTDWDFDFRGHKFQGDWQAALGVTVRVPHLSWVSMKGEAKRDYPASINYQSAWYKEYSYVEDHFARLNTALTRGKPIVRAAVVHPAESFWLVWGPNQTSAAAREHREEQLQSVIKWLLFGGIDFDFLCESNLPSQCAEPGAPLAVGEMRYDVVIVPACVTLRRTTFEILRKFAERGGALIFAGECPKLIDALPSDEIKELYDKSIVVPFEHTAVLGALEPWRDVELRNADMTRTDNLIYQMREDNGARWLFVAHGVKYKNIDISWKQEITISVSGIWKPSLYDTQSGAISDIPCRYRNGRTVIDADLYSYDSILLRLEKGEAERRPSEKRPPEPIREWDIPTTVPYSLSEPNVLLLDQAEYAADGEPFRPAEEILRLDNILRAEFGWPPLNGAYSQPWTKEKETIEHTVSLRFKIESEIERDRVWIALEDAEKAEIEWNGERVQIQTDGWYTDECIKKVPLPGLKIGTNVLVITLPYGRTANPEWCYLLGDFGVKTAGRTRTLAPAPKELGFSTVTEQGLPYYGGAITYHTDIETESGGVLAVRVPHYRGAVIHAAIDGKDAGVIIYDPYELRVPITAGKHRVDLTLYGTRFNSFGALHNVNVNDGWPGGPGAWRKTGSSWCYEYLTRGMGIISSPLFGLYPSE